MRFLTNTARAAGTSASNDDACHSVCIDGAEVAVRLVPSSRAKRIILRMDKVGQGVRITVPPGVDAQEALAFARRSAGWIRARMATRPPPVPFIHGARVPYLGEMHEIIHTGERRGAVRRELRDDTAPALVVAGDETHVARRLSDWMKRQARVRLEDRCQVHAQSLSLTYKRVHIRDQTSRWGSCSSTGTLSFSWRLIMTPEHVLDYVAAHEVAHLAEMNHSQRFWRLVDGAVPDMKASRGWLRSNGPDLHRYGQSAR